MNGAKNILADCLSRLVDTNVTDCDYEPKGQEIGCTLFDDPTPGLITQDSTDIHLINVLGTETNAIKILKQQYSYCKHIDSTLYIT